MDQSMGVSRASHGISGAARVNLGHPSGGFRPVPSARFVKDWHAD
jgi:hypothetical protein